MMPYDYSSSLIWESMVVILQLQLIENEIGVDFFLAELFYMVKPLGIKVAQ